MKVQKKLLFLFCITSIISNSYAQDSYPEERVKFFKKYYIKDNELEKSPFFKQIIIHTNITKSAIGHEIFEDCIFYDSTKPDKNCKNMEELIFGLNKAIGNFKKEEVTYTTQFPSFSPTTGIFVDIAAFKEELKKAITPLVASKIRKEKSFWENRPKTCIGLALLAGFGIGALAMYKYFR